MDSPTGTRIAPPPVPSYSPWPVEAVAYYFLLRARGQTQVKSAKLTAKQYGVKAPVQAKCSKLERNEEGVAYLAWLKADLKKHLSRLPYAEKWQRIAELGNLTQTLLERFALEDQRGSEANSLDLTRLSSEIRSLLETLRKECEGEGVDSAKVLSVIEEIERRRALLSRTSPRASEMLEM